jgi:hypothetical protein
MLMVQAVLFGGLFAPGGFDSSNIPYIVWLAPIIILMVYGQKYRSWMILRHVSKSLAKLKTMKDSTKPVADPRDRIDKFVL